MDVVEAGIALVVDKGFAAAGMAIVLGDTMAVVLPGLDHADIVLVDSCSVRSPV